MTDEVKASVEGTVEVRSYLRCRLAPSPYGRGKASLLHRFNSNCTAVVPAKAGIQYATAYRRTASGCLAMIASSAQDPKS
jgi:hypothetical protein